MDDIILQEEAKESLITKLVCYKYEKCYPASDNRNWRNGQTGYAFMIFIKGEEHPFHSEKSYSSMELCKIKCEAMDEEIRLHRSKR